MIRFNAPTGGKYDYVFSNFAPATITMNDVEFPTVEHAYQAQKTTDIQRQREIAKAYSPGHAKRMGKKVKIRPDWQEVKYGIMIECLKQKFFGNSLFASCLLGTGSEEIAEDASEWNDVEWGLGKSGKGKNLLGKALMEVREWLRRHTPFEAGRRSLDLQRERSDATRHA